MVQRVAALVVAMLIPVSARAQASPAPDGLKRQALPSVYVLDDRGVETRGRLLRLDSEAVVLLVADAERRFDIGRVTRVEKRGDSLKNGAVTGLLVGIGLGLLGAAASDCGTSASCPGTRVILGAVSTALYTAVGTAIDAAVEGRTTVYEAPRPSSARAASRRAVVGFRLAW
jgi:hypothetical protein